MEGWWQGHQACTQASEEPRHRSRCGDRGVRHQSRWVENQSLAQVGAVSVPLTACGAPLRRIGGMAFRQQLG